MTKDKKLQGALGEQLAVDYLKKLKYKVIDQNFRIRNGEVDIIAIDQSEKEPVLAFIEVKTRTGNMFGTPFEAITHWKLQALIRSAQVYKTMHPRLPGLMRIDAVSVSFTNNEPVIELVKNIS